MKYETLANGRAGTLEVSGNRVVYRREDGTVVDTVFAVDAMEPGCVNVRLGQRSFRVATGASAHELIDPRSLSGRKGHGQSQGRREILAPMPGKVVRVLVAVGDAVSSGQGLVVVEAMKMQNEMKSPIDGRVTEVRAKEGAAVAAGESLLVVEA